MPRNVCWRCTIRLETRRQSPKLSSKQRENLRSRTQIGKRSTLPPASGPARLSKSDFQKLTHSRIRYVPIGAHSDVEKGAQRSPCLSKRCNGHPRGDERWTPHREISNFTTSWRLRFEEGVWKPVAETPSSAIKFRDRVLGLIDSDVMAMKVINQQRAFEKSLSLGRGNISSYPRSATFGSAMYSHTKSLSVRGVPKRTFATHAVCINNFNLSKRSLTNSSASPTRNLGPPRFQQPGWVSSKQRTG